MSRATAATITIPKMDLQVATLHIVGDSPLIVHAWSEKAKRAMRDKQTGKARAKKEPKNPEAEFRSSLYIMPDTDPERYGFPVVAFKAAAAMAWDQIEGLKKKQILASFHIVSGTPSEHGELTELRYGELVQREDIVRLQGTTADLRYRGEFRDWRTSFDVRFNAAVVSLEQLVHVLDTAGFGIGVGEWRPQRGGHYGRFHIEGVG